MAKEDLKVLIVPTVKGREEIFDQWLNNWLPLIKAHKFTLCIIDDGEDQKMRIDGEKGEYTSSDLLGKNAYIISKQDTACKNLGLYWAAKHKASHVVVLDDDLSPVGDTIGDHLTILSGRCPISWMSTASAYMRGFPYNIRDEAEIVFSHGVWTGIPDFDAPTQLVKKYDRISYPNMPIPKGVYFPMCGMNIAIKGKALPYLYFAPPHRAMGEYMARCDDIFAGIVMKRELDKLGWAAYTGGAYVKHDRASNVMENLRKEALFIQLNEEFWKGDDSHPYFKQYLEKYKIWKDLIGKFY